MADKKLADLNAQLVEQNKTLDNVESGVQKLNQNLTRYLDQAKADRLRQLETDREARARSRSERRESALNQTQDKKTQLELDKLNGALQTLATLAAGKALLGTAASVVPSAKPRISSPTSSGSPFNLKSVGGILGGLSLAGVAPNLIRGLSKRSPFLLANLFADQIADGAEKLFGSSELGDAIFTGLKLGGLAGLVSPRLGLRFGLIGALGSIAMSDDNLTKLKQISENLPDFSVNLDKFSVKLDEIFGIELPKINLTLKDVTDSIQATFGNALDAIIDFQKNGFDGQTFQKNWDAIIVTLGGLAFAFSPLGTFKLLYRVIGRLGSALLGLNAAAAGLNATVLPTATTPVAQTSNMAAAANLKNMSREDLFKNAKGLSAKELKAGGLERIGDRIVQAGGGNQIASNDQLRNALDKSASGKIKGFPRASKFFNFLRGMGPLGGILGAYDIYSILSGPGTVDQKIPLIAGSITGLLGTAAGSAVGAWAGTAVFPGIGTAIGAAGGGLLGFFGTKMLGTALAQWLTGQPIDAFPDWLNGLVSNSSASDIPAGPVNVPFAPGQIPSTGQTLNNEAFTQSSFSQVDASIRAALASIGELPTGGGQTVNTFVGGSSTQAVIVAGAGATDKLVDFNR